MTWNLTRCEKCEGEGVRRAFSLGLISGERLEFVRRCRRCKGRGYLDDTDEEGVERAPCKTPKKTP
jgi:DnaJ-class molecular chaperone